MIQLVTPASEVTVDRVGDRIELSTFNTQSAWFNTQSACWCKVFLTDIEARNLGSVLAELASEKISGGS